MTASEPGHTPALRDAQPSPAARALDTLLAIMARLRDPQNGCPWDLAQSFRTIVPHTIEEAYEVADTIERDDLKALPGELGDLMFQVVFYCQMASEAGLFAMPDVLHAINEKMLARHPHVFGDATVASPEAQVQAWEVHKAAEREKEAALAGRRPSALDGVVTGLPALTRAEKLQRRAARVGFDWPSAEPVIDKVQEELGELGVELRDGRDPDRMDEEFGDLLFTCVNLARHLGVDPEGALRRANRKFERRFMRMEALAAAGGQAGPGSGDGSGGGQPEMPRSLPELEALWDRVKTEEGLLHSDDRRSPIPAGRQS